MSTAITHDAAAFEVRHVNLVRGGSVVLKDVTTRISEGEVVAILGPNGSGKSTLLKAMIGVLPVASGSAQILGRPSTTRGVHDAIGYVPQMAAFSGNIAACAYETVSSGLLTSSRLFARASKQKVERALDFVGLADLSSRAVTEMSGGQRQRVMIARALAREPRILVLDEPFTGVDSATQENISSLIAKLYERGTTVVVVLHDLDPLRELITRAIVMEEGRIVHDGPLPHDDPHASASESEDGKHHVNATIDQCLGNEIHP
ncbi:ABC transporter--like protein [Mycobacteroides abscessus subsp. abscessus]|nr:ABC transporter--like protein [Mycobacteroides abscessus subsp. abscessus]